MPSPKPLRGHIEQWSLVRWPAENVYVVIGQHTETGKPVRTSPVLVFSPFAGIETLNSRYTLGTHALASQTRALMQQCFPYLQPEEPAR